MSFIPTKVTASRVRRTNSISTDGSRNSSPNISGNGRSLHRALGILDHGEMSLDHREGFGRPSFHVTIIPALCLFLELSNVIFVVRLKQFQILPVEVRGSDVLGPNTPGVELD